MNSTGLLVFVRSALIACTWGLASLLSGCGGSSDGVGEPITSVSAPVGATGGALELQGLALTLPANAIPETINLSITALTAGTGEIARFRLSPAGLALSTPAELRFSQAGMPAKASFFWDVGGELRLVPSLLVGDVLTAQILSLGLGSAGNTVSALGTSQTGLKRALAARPLAASADDGGTVVVMPMDCAARIPEMAARLKRVAASDDSEAVIRAFDEIVAAKQLCLEAEVQALKDRSCEALGVAQSKAQSLVADSFKSFQELTLPLIAAEAFVQETGASCPSADSARVGPLIADKFDEFLRILQAQQLRGVFAEKATVRDIQELLSYQVSCARLGLGAICERLDNEIFPNLFDGMRRGAFDECRSSGSPLVVSQLHFLGTSVTDTSTFLGFGRFGMADLEADMSYCTNPSLDLRVFADATGVPEELTDRASTLRPLVGLGNYVRSTTVAVPRDGKLTVSGELAALRCADDTVLPADLVVRIGSQEVARRSLSGNVYPLSTAPLDLVISQVLASAGLDVDTTTSFTVSINREGGQCLGALEPTLNEDRTMFEIRVTLPGPTATPADYVGTWTFTNSRLEVGTQGIKSMDQRSSYSANFQLRRLTDGSWEGISASGSGAATEGTEKCGTTSFFTVLGVKSVREIGTDPAKKLVIVLRGEQSALINFSTCEYSPFVPVELVTLQTLQQPDGSYRLSEVSGSTSQEFSTDNGSLLLTTTIETNNLANVVRVKSSP